MEVRRYRVISDLLEKRITQKEAAEILELSTRQLRRIQAKGKAKGALGVIHGLVGKPSNHRITVELESKELAL